MKGSIVAALTLLAANAAFAQESEWSDQQWGIGLSFAAQGWELRRPRHSDRTTVVATMSAADDDRGALCQLEYGSHTAPPQTRDELNAGTRRIRDGAPVATALANGDIQRAEVNDVGLVAVFDVRSRIESRQTLARRFWLQRGDELRGYALICLADQQDDVGIRQMEAVAASLRFGEQPP